ncbi:MAG: hypothetical protein ACFCVE_14750 [Phycisphaerae bacterium]
MSSRPARGVILTLVAVGVLALGLRLAAIFALNAWEQPGFMEHDQLATNLVLGNGFAFRDWGSFGPSSVQSPTYPLLLTFLYRAFGIGTDTAFIAAMAINAVIGAAAAVMVYPMVRSAGGSAAVGLLAAAATACWPTQIYAATYVQAVAIIIAGVVATTWFWNRAVATGGAWWWFAFSATGVFTALTEPVLLPVMFLTGIAVMLWRPLPMGVRVRNGFILLVTTAAVVGPWAWRNYEVHGGFVPVKSTFWVNIWKGNNPHATGTDRVKYSEAERAAFATLDEAGRRHLDARRQYDMLTDEQIARLTNTTDAEREAAFGEWAKGWIGENPLEYAKLSVQRLVMSLWIEWNNPKGWDVRYLLPRTLLLVLSPVGLVLAVKRRWRLFFPLLAFSLSLLTVSLTITAARFALPFEPYQFALCALVTVAVARRSGVLRQDDAEPSAPAPLSPQPQT